MTGHIGQLVTPDRSRELLHHAECFLPRLLLVEVWLDVGRLWRDGTSMQSSGDDRVQDQAERQEAQDRGDDVAAALHVLGPAGRVHGDDPRCVEEGGVALVLHLVEDVNRQKAAHGTTDEHELVVLCVGTQVAHDGQDDVVGVEPVSCIGEGDHVAVLAPGLHDRPRGDLSVGEDAGQVDDQHARLGAAVVLRANVRGVTGEPAVRMGERNHEQGEQEDPYPQGHENHLYRDRSDCVGATANIIA